MGKTSCKKGQYYCNTDKKCKPIPRGFTVREDGFLVREGWSAKYKKSIDCDNPKGFSQKAHCAGKKKKMTEESNPRIARKKGQPAKSKKHSDLYTDEDPKGTIHGLGFKDVATAKASVAKIRKSSRSHAHKIQAAIAMEQRARVMGKTSEAAVYRKFINSMKKKTKKMNEEKHGDHEPEMIRSQLKTAGRASKRIEKHSRRKDNFKAWVQSKITKASDYLDTAADYLDSKDVKEASSPTTQGAVSSYLFNKLYIDTDKKKKDKKPKSMSEGSLHKWFSGSKSKDGKGGWVNVRTGGTCASDEPGEGVPKCVSRSKYDSMSKKERESAARRKKAADPNQQSKTGAAKPTYVATDKPKKKKKMKEEFVSLPLQLEIPQNDGEFKLGLMFRESLEQDRGMLFIFENDDYHTFHMKNTFIPLDIAFIKEDGTIDSIEELDPMSPIVVGPRSEIRYAIEVNRGWFAENGVVIGDRILEEEGELIEGKDKKGKGSGSKDACYYKVKSRYSVWPSAYASGALVKCRKVGAANWGNSKKEEVEYEYEVPTKNHYSWRDSLAEHHKKDADGNTIPHEHEEEINEAPDSSMMKKPQLHTRGGKTAPEPNSTQTAIKKVGQKLKDKFYEEVDQDFLKKVKDMGREGEITKGMSDREYVKHLKKTGNYKRKKNKEGKYDYNFSHHKDDKYKDKIKTYDDAAAKRVQDLRDKRQAEKDKFEKEYKQREIERRGGVEYKLKKPKYTLQKLEVKRLTPKTNVKKENYDWRAELTENQANRMRLAAQRKQQNAGRAQQQMGAVKSAVGGAAKAVGGAVGGAVKAVGSALKPKPMVRKPGQTSVRTRGGGAPQVAKPTPAPQAPMRQAATQAQTRQATPAPQAKPAVPQVSNLTRQGKQRTPAQMAAAKRIAAKQSGTAQPQLSGRERAQQMARERIAAKNAPAPQRVAQGQPAPLRGQQRQPQQGQPAPLRGQQRQPQQGQAAGTVTRRGAQAAAAAEKVGGTQNIPASQKVTPTSSTSGPGRGSIKFSKGALSKLVSGGSSNNQQSGTSSGMRPTNTGNARRDNFNQKVNTLKNKQKFGGTGNPITVGDKTFKPGDKGYKDAFNTVSSAVSGALKKSQKPTGDTSKLIGMDKKTGEAKLNQMKKDNKPFDDFDNEIDNLIQNTPTVNSKGKKVKNIPGTNKMPSGGSNKSMNQSMSDF